MLVKNKNGNCYEDEVWKLHPVLYREVSNYGRLFNLSTKSNIENGITTGSMNREGYRRIKIKGKHYSVDRLVLETFTSIDEGVGKLCDHIDGNRENNHVDNLRWVTTEENSQNRTKQKEFIHFCGTCV